MANPAEKDEIVDAAIKHAEAVLRLKHARRRLLELNQEASSYRDQQVLPAEQAANETRAALDKAMGVEQPASAKVAA